MEISGNSDDEMMSKVTWLFTLCLGLFTLCLGLLIGID